MAYYKLKIEIQLVCEDFSNSYGLKIFNIEYFEDFNLIDHKLSKVLINKLKDWYNDYFRYTGLFVDELIKHQNEIDRLDELGIGLLKEIHEELKGFSGHTFTYYSRGKEKILYSISPASSASPEA